MTSLPPITTLDHLDTLLTRHPYFRDRQSFAKQYWHAQCYLLLKHAQHTNTLPTTSTHNLATTIGISHIVIRYWLRGERMPRLLESLIAHERARFDHEATIPHKHHSYRIDPTTVYNAVRPLKDHPHTPETLANAIETMYRKVEFKRFLIADLKPYHESGPRWTRIVAKSIKTNREDMENLLNQRIALEDLPHTRIRIGIHDHTLYLYHHNTDPNDWLTLLKHEYFYFDTTDTKHYLMNHARQHLNTTDPGLSNLINQVTDHPGDLQHPKSRLGDLSRLRPYLLGESLKFLLDASDHNFDQIQLFITRLGRDTQGDNRGGIHNPRFPKSEKFEIFRARLFALIACDGSLHKPSRQLYYLDKDPERIEYTKNLLRTHLGDVYINEELREDKATRLTIAVSVGRFVEKWGIPVGDKIIQQYNLHPAILNGNILVKCAYLSELIPEDGGFYNDEGSGWFEWKRAVILDAGPKNEVYSFEPKISSEQKTLLAQHGTIKKRRIRDEQPKDEIILRWTQIQELTKNPENHEFQKLKKIIEENPCLLLEDEKKLCESLGIQIYKTPKEIHIQESGRVSVIWKANTKNQKNAVRWALLAPPSSGYKRRAVLEWVQTRKETDRTQKQLEREGLIVQTLKPNKSTKQVH